MSGSPQQGSFYRVRYEQAGVGGRQGRRGRPRPLPSSEGWNSYPFKRGLSSRGDRVLTPRPPSSMGSCDRYTHGPTRGPVRTRCVSPCVYTGPTDVNRCTRSVPETNTDSQTWTRTSHAPPRGRVYTHRAGEVRHRVLNRKIPRSPKSFDPSSTVGRPHASPKGPQLSLMTREVTVPRKGTTGLHPGSLLFPFRRDPLSTSLG